MVTIIPAMFIKVTSYKHNDPGETSLVCGINMATGVAVAECYKVPRSNGGIVKVLTANALGKDDSVSGVVYNDGAVRMYVSEADQTNTGATSAVRVYDTAPGVFPPSTTNNSTIDTGVRVALKGFLTDLITIATKWKNTI